MSVKIFLPIPQILKERAGGLHTKRMEIRAHAVVVEPVDEVFSGFTVVQMLVFSDDLLDHHGFRIIPCVVCVRKKHEIVLIWSLLSRLRQCSSHLWETRSTV